MLLRRTVLSVSLAASLAAPAFADTITYKNGHTESGKLIEERETEIDFQVQQGKITIKKKDIALFIENDDLGDRNRTSPRRKSEGGVQSAGDGRAWTMPKDASPEERRDLTGVHAKLAELLGKLGPSDDERRQKLELSPSDKAAAESAAQRLGQTGAGAATASDFAAYGIKAIPTLSDVLLAGSIAAKGEAAVALADVVTRGDEKDARWLLARNKVATRLGALLDASGDETAARVRNSANKALETISGSSVSWPESKEAYPTPSQSDAIAKWKAWIAKDTASQDASDKARADERRGLEDAWKSLEDPKTWRSALAAAMEKYGVAESPGGEKTGEGTGEKPSAKVNEAVAQDATPEEQKAIADLKTKIKKALDTTIGPSVEDRKKKYRDQLTDDDREQLKQIIFDLNRHAHTGGGKHRDNSREIRNAAVQKLVAMGLKALEKISDDALSSDQGFTRWAAAGAVAQIYGASEKEDADALFGAFDVASKVLPLLDNQDTEIAGLIRADGNKSLEQLTGQNVGWKDGDAKEISPDEIEGKGKWRSIVSQQQADWKKREDAREKARKKLGDILKSLDKKDAWRDALDEGPKAIADAEKALKK